MENFRVFHDTPFSLSGPGGASSPARAATPSLGDGMEGGGEGGSAGVQAAVWDVRGQRWFLVTEDCRVVCFCCTTHRVLFQRSLVHPDGLPAPDAVTHSALLQFQDALFLAFATGLLLLIHLPPPTGPTPVPPRLSKGTPRDGEPGGVYDEGAWGEGSLEVVGEVKGGAAGAAWSPSEDSLALVSGEGKLLCMTSEWDVTAEVDFLPPGQEGGGAAARLAPGAVCVSWRGDGAFFATSHVASHEAQSQVTSDGSVPAAPLGRVRVWEAGTCVLHSQSDGLLPVHQGYTNSGKQEAQHPGDCWGLLPVAWQPSGALVAVGCSQRSNPSGPGPSGGKGKQPQPNGPGRTPGRPLPGEAGAASSGSGLDQAAAVTEEEPRSAAGLEVVLLERNGMLRSSFPLQAPAGASLEALAWSCDSRVLSAALRCAGGRSAAFQLYHRLNYRWYLKHEWRVPLAPRRWCTAAVPPLAGLEWHPERPLELLLWGQSASESHGGSRPAVASPPPGTEPVSTSADSAAANAEGALTDAMAPTSVSTGTAAASCEGALLRHVRLHWESACTLDVAASGRGSVAAVVDGARVLVTDFGSAVIPPPMCGRELLLPAPVRTAALLPSPHARHTRLLSDTNPSQAAGTGDRPDACSGSTAEGRAAAEGDEGGRGGAKLVAVLADGSLCLVTGPGAGGMSEEEEEDLEEELQEERRREKGEGGDSRESTTPAEEVSPSASSEAIGQNPAKGTGAPLGFRRTETHQLALRSLLHADADPTKALPPSCLQHAQHICWLTETSVLIALPATDAAPLLQGEAVHRGHPPGSGPDGQGSVLVEAVLEEGGEHRGAQVGYGTREGPIPSRGGASQGCAYIIQCTRTPHPVVALAPSPSATEDTGLQPQCSAGAPQADPPSALVHLADGQVLEYQGKYTSGIPTAACHRKGTPQAQLRSLGRLPAVCPWLSAARIPGGTPAAHRGLGGLQGSGNGPMGGAGMGVGRGLGASGVCLVGLSEARQLFVGQQCIASDCTSFLLLSLPSAPQAPPLALGTTPGNPSSRDSHGVRYEGSSSFAPPGMTSGVGGVTSSSAAAAPLTVAYTTASGFLVCQDLDSGGAPAGGAPDVEGARRALEGGPGKRGREALKSVDPRVLPVHERGARLAGALGAADPGLVLLAPRGNLEVVYPRWLVLRRLASALLQESFLEALQLARRHRLDLNALVDFWGWPLFARHVARGFVAQVAAEDVRLVSELVCCLRTEDCTQEVPYACLRPKHRRGAKDGLSGAPLGSARASPVHANLASGAQDTPPSISGASSLRGEPAAAGAPGEVPDLDVNLLFQDLELEEGSASLEVGRHKAHPAPEAVGKVTAVCAAIREALLQGAGTPQVHHNAGAPQEHRGAVGCAGTSAAEELCVLTTYACSDPPLLEEALGRVRAARDWELKDQQHHNQQQNQKRPGHRPEAGLGGAVGANVGENEGMAEEVGGVLSAAGPGMSKEGNGLEAADGLEAGPDVSALLPLGPASSVTQSTSAVTNGVGADTGSRGQDPDPTRPALSAEASLKHLMWLTSADRVLDAALGLYDLRLAALAVVHHPGKDPRELFPLLQGLARLPPGLMRFKVDVRLARLEAAVRDLADALRALPRRTGGEPPSHTGAGALPAAVPSATADPAAGTLPSTGSGGGQEEDSGGVQGEEEEGEEEEEVGAGLPSVYQSCLRECLALIQAHPARLFPVAAAAFRDVPSTPGNSGGTLEGGARSASGVASGSAVGSVESVGKVGSVVGRVRRAVVEQWGAHLESQELHSEAALAFLAAGRPLRALAAYRAGGAWRAALGVARRLGWATGRVRALAGEMREELVALGKRAEGGRIAAEYEEDVPAAVGLLVEGQQWEEAVHLGYARDRADLVASLVAPAALAAAQTLVSEFSETQAKIRAYLVRHQVVRQRRLALARRVQEAEAQGWGDAEEDGASTASTASAASGLTHLSAYVPSGGPSGAGSSAASTGETGSVSGASATTAGGRRPSARNEKRAAAKQRKAKGGGRIRAGSPGEEQAIVEHLRALAPAASVRAEVGQLLEVLVGPAGAEEAARKLQRCLQTLLKMHSRALQFLRDQEGGAGEGEGGAGQSGGAGGAPGGESGGGEGAAWKWRLLEA